MFGDKRNRETEEKLAKERELQKVHVKKEDIELIVSIFYWFSLWRFILLFFQLKFIQINEMLITRDQAENALRENRGDLVAALENLTN